jgi:hypothetical protein
MFFIRTIDPAQMGEIVGAPPYPRFLRVGWESKVFSFVAKSRIK